MRFRFPQFSGIFSNIKKFAKIIPSDYRHCARFTLPKRPAPGCRASSDANVGYTFQTDGPDQLASDQFKFIGVFFRVEYAIQNSGWDVMRNNGNIRGLYGWLANRIIPFAKVDAACGIE